MAQAHELASGDVVVFEQGDVRTVHSLRATSVDKTSLMHITWSDGRSDLVRATRDLPLLWSITKPTNNVNNANT